MYYLYRYTYNYKVSVYRYKLDAYWDTYINKIVDYVTRFNRLAMIGLLLR